MEGLIDTRNEYIEHIQDILSVAISKRIYAIYTEMMEEKKGLKGFQNELYSIRKWNNNIVSDEYKKIVKYTKCKYLSNLIKIIIITTIKIKIYEYREQFDNIKIKIPNAEDFVHKCYINAASFSWKNAYLYNRNNIKDAEYQNNLNLIEENIRAIIKKTFRDFVPFDEIFKQIEDNLTGNVKQFKDTEDNDEGNANSVASSRGSVSGASDTSDSEASEASDDIEPPKPLKKIKTNKKPVEPTKKTESEDSEAEESEAEDDEAEESEAEESEAEDDEAEAEESEAEAEESEAEAEESEAEDDEAEEREAAEAEPITVLKENVETEYNKIDNIVDTTLTKNNNEVPNKQPQEISFKALFSSEQTDKESEARDTRDTRDTSEAREVPDNISKEWNSIKEDYHSLSQGEAKHTSHTSHSSKKYENDDDDAISVASNASNASALSNITDISMIKKIHITDASNKTKKPSFF
jgi:hypothetical protein